MNFTGILGAIEMKRVMGKRGADGSAGTGAGNLGWGGQRFGLTGTGRWWWSGGIGVWW